MSSSYSNRRDWLFGTAILAPGLASLGSITERGSKGNLWQNVLEFGAVGDSRTINTRSIQAAIDHCSQVGGGTVFFPAGIFLSGTLFLRSRITLWLEPGAILLGSTDLKDYPSVTPAFRSYTDINYVERSLIYAEKADQVAILGQGVIDGQGGASSFQPGQGREGYKQRPYLIRMVECRKVLLRDVLLRNSPMWVQHFLACEDVLIDGISVESVVNANNDGIDIDGCRRVRISNCRIRSGDDAIVLKSTAPRPCEQVVITNCTLSSDCNAFKCGTESTGGFLDITVNNCVIHDTRLSGIALETVDGGNLDGVMISNVRMRNVGNGIFLRLGNRARPYLSQGPGGGDGNHRIDPTLKTPGIGQLRNIHISQVSAMGGDTIGCALAGLPGHPLEDILLEGVRLEFAGGGNLAELHGGLPENPEKYPEYSMFGPLPAYGFFCRHVRNLVLKGIEVRVLKADQRPALVLEDIEGLELDGWRSQVSPGIPHALLRDVRGAWIHGCQPSGKGGPFLRVEGAGSREIRLEANACRNHRCLVERGQDFPEAEILQD